MPRLPRVGAAHITHACAAEQCRKRQPPSSFGQQHRSRCAAGCSCSLGHRNGRDAGTNDCNISPVAGIATMCRQTDRKVPAPTADASRWGTPGQSGVGASSLAMLLPPAASTPVISCGQHHGHCSLGHRVCNEPANFCCASARCVAWQGLLTSGTGSSVFRLFAQPRHNRSIGCCILRRTRSRSSRFPEETAFCAATTGSRPGAGSISGKSGRRENGGHEADRIFTRRR